MLPLPYYKFTKMNLDKYREQLLIKRQKAEAKKLANAHKDLEKKFLSNVKRVPNSCWTWKGSVMKNGYGQFFTGIKTVRAHRFAYEFYIGEIEEGMNVCHRCDNPLCVNPKHLFQGSQADNMFDCFIKGRHTNKFEFENIPARRSLTDEQAREIKKHLANNQTQRPKDIAEHFGVSVYLIKDIKKGRNYANVEF
jgi:hypothetical protein